MLPSKGRGVRVDKEKQREERWKKLEAQDLIDDMEE